MYIYRPVLVVSQTGDFRSIAKLLFIIAWRRLSLRDVMVKGALCA